MKNEYVIPPVILLALLFSILSEYCIPSPASKVASFVLPQNTFNPACYVDSFNPQAPDTSPFSNRTMPITSNVILAGATGTAIPLSGVSQIGIEVEGK